MRAASLTVPGGEKDGLGAMRRGPASYRQGDERDGRDPRARKRYGSTVAVDDLSFSVRPGVVTGFVGPNGAGKSTTLRPPWARSPDAGSALVNGRRYAELAWPLREVGALLDASAVHPGRPAREHLRWLAASNGARAGGRRARASSASRGCRPPRRPLLARDVPAPRHRSRPARGSADSASTSRSTASIRKASAGSGNPSLARLGRPGRSGLEPSDERASRTPPTT